LREISPHDLLRRAAPTNAVVFPHSGKRRRGGLQALVQAAAQRRRRDPSYRLEPALLSGGAQIGDRLDPKADRAQEPISHSNLSSTS
jgi:hypothetical protein